MLQVLTEFEKITCKSCNLEDFLNNDRKNSKNHIKNRTAYYDFLETYRENLQKYNFGYTPQQLGEFIGLYAINDPEFLKHLQNNKAVEIKNYAEILNVSYIFGKFVVQEYWKEKGIE